MLIEGQIAIGTLRGWVNEIVYEVFCVRANKLVVHRVCDRDRV